MRGRVELYREWEFPMFLVAASCFPLLALSQIWPGTFVLSRYVPLPDATLALVPLH